jgi:hypothetical protein
MRDIRWMIRTFKESGMRQISSKAANYNFGPLALRRYPAGDELCRRGASLP